MEATVCTLYAAPISRMNLKLGSKTEEFVCIGSRWSKNMSFHNKYILGFFFSQQKAVGNCLQMFFSSLLSHLGWKRFCHCQEVDTSALFLYLLSRNKILPSSPLPPTYSRNYLVKTHTST